MGKAEEIEIEQSQLEEIEKLRKLLADFSTRDIKPLFSNVLADPFRDKTSDRELDENSLETVRLLLVIRRRARGHAKILLLQLSPLLNTCQEIANEFKEGRGIFKEKRIEAIQRQYLSIDRKKIEDFVDSQEANGHLTGKTITFSGQYFGINDKVADPNWHAIAIKFYNRGVELESILAEMTRILNQIYTLLSKQQIINADETESDIQLSTEIYQSDTINLELSLENSSFQDSPDKNEFLTSKRISRKKTIIITGVAVSFLLVSVSVIIWFSKSIFMNTR